MDLPRVPRILFGHLGSGEVVLCTRTNSAHSRVQHASVIMAVRATVRSEPGELRRTWACKGRLGVKCHR